MLKIDWKILLFVLVVLQTSQYIIKNFHEFTSRYNIFLNISVLIALLMVHLLLLPILNHLPLKFLKKKGFTKYYRATFVCTACSMIISFIFVLIFNKNLFTEHLIFILYAFFIYKKYKFNIIESIVFTVIPIFLGGIGKFFISMIKEAF